MEPHRVVEAAVPSYRKHRFSLAAIALSACLSRSLAQTQYFEVLEYRDPTQCERMQCQSIRSPYCREHLHGFYLKEKGCPEGKICTDCEYGNTSHPTRCQCENPPFSIAVLYGQECQMGQVCTEGQGICFRPCDTYLHITFCDKAEHCRWNKTTYSCENKPPSMPLVMWAELPKGTPFSHGVQILSMMGAPLFPQSFADFRKSSDGYMLQGILLGDLIQLESMFLQLDENNDGMLDAVEYARLPSTLAALDAVAVSQKGASSAATGARRLAAHEAATSSVTTTMTPEMVPPAVVVRPESCGAMIPGRFYCSFDQSCKLDCKECGWKSATDTAFSTCVQPSANTCHADGGQEFCPTDQTCHPNGDCSKCVDRPIVDHGSHMCLAVWWQPEPSTQWTDWVCRDRNKVGMPCRADQDCIYGLKKCLGGACQPLQPYNQNLTCENDFDCPHIGYYCPTDPTGGENIYWVQYCRRQKLVDETCQEDRQCVPDTLCNTEEPQPRCRRYFSLKIGTPSKDDTLCSLGWRDRFKKCAPPAKSKEAGRTCDSDADCVTTDATGTTGRCVCKAWWDKDDSKYCLPVTGDYEKHWESRRDWIYFRYSKCGSFWTEKECLKVYKAEGNMKKLKMQCETQKLSGGPYLPPADCVPVFSDPVKFPDYCAQMDR